MLRLARCLQRRGIQCLCIALSDGYVDNTLESTFADRQGDQILCIRISSRDSWTNKQSLLQQSLDSFNPDWISLHYVPYAFHNKGLAYQLSRCLCSLDVAVHWHVMLHELWFFSWHRLSSWVLAPVQKLLLKNMISSLDANVIHTSNYYYQDGISSIGLKAHILPMFGSISPTTVTASQVTYHGWRFVLFGGILPDWDPGPLMRAIIGIAHQQSIPSIEFLSIGKSGAHGSTLWASLASTAPAGVAYKLLGSLDSEEVSYWLQHSDFGITTSPSHLIGKSSSVAAMLEHGLPVIVPRLEKTNGPWHQMLKADHRFVLFDQDFTETFTLARKFPPKDQLSATADLLTQALIGLK